MYGSGEREREWQRIKEEEKAREGQRRRKRERRKLEVCGERKRKKGSQKDKPTDLQSNRHLNG